MDEIGSTSDNFDQFLVNKFKLALMARKKDLSFFWRKFLESLKKLKVQEKHPWILFLKKASPTFILDLSPFERNLFRGWHFRKSSVWKRSTALLQGEKMDKRVTPKNLPGQYTCHEKICNLRKELKRNRKLKLIVEVSTSTRKTLFWNEALVFRWRLSKHL